MCVNYPISGKILTNILVYSTGQGERHCFYFIENTGIQWGQFEFARPRKKIAQTTIGSAITNKFLK